MKQPKAQPSKIAQLLAALLAETGEELLDDAGEQALSIVRPDLATLIAEALKEGHSAQQKETA